MTGLRLNHVGVLVESFDDVRALLADHLDAEIAAPQADEALGLEILWVETDGAAIEFLRPLRDDTRAADLLRTGVRGVHHVAFEVDDIDSTLGRLLTAGVALRDEIARPGVHGSRIAFVEPLAADGTLIELVETSRPQIEGM